MDLVKPLFPKAAVLHLKSYSALSWACHLWMLEILKISASSMGI